MKKRYFISLALSAFLLHITHHVWLGFHGKYEFDFYLFVIILVSSYLLFFKLTSYLADFSEVKNKSKIDIIFLAVFFILIFLPMTNINKDEISVNENRKLAVYKPLFDSEKKFNVNYGRDFDEFFNDRFNLRKQLVFLNTVFEYAFRDVVVSNGIEFNKKNGWMMPISYEKYLEEEQKNRVIDNLNRFSDFCKQRHIKYYVLLVPNTGDVYYDKLPDKANAENVVNRVNMLKEIQQKTKANFIFPYDELFKEKKNEYVYFKTDHHWTDFGAYIGYKALMKEINKSFPQIPVVKQSDFNISRNNLVRSERFRDFHNGVSYGHIFKCGFKPKKKILDTEYKYFTHKDNKNLVLRKVETPERIETNFYYPKGYNKKLMIFGTSMTENLSEIIPYSFRFIKYLRINVGTAKPEDEHKILKNYKKDISEFKPDIIVFCITPANLAVMKDIDILSED